jgi:hypothetical protein
VACVVLIQSAAALATGSHHGTSGVTLGAVAASLVVLAPLAWAKRHLGQRMASRALQGDGTPQRDRSGNQRAGSGRPSAQRRAGMVVGGPDRRPDRRSRRRRRGLAYRLTEAGLRAENAMGNNADRVTLGVPGVTGVIAKVEAR